MNTLISRPGRAPAPNLPHRREAGPAGPRAGAVVPVTAPVLLMSVEDLDFAASLFSQVLEVSPVARRRLAPDVRPVYFIQATGGPIKIGVAGDPWRRVADLQTASPAALRLIATLPDQGAAGEKALHRRFAHLRTHGEWFQAAPELVDYIREHGVAA